MLVFHEYPKAIYVEGERDPRTAHDAEHEAAIRAEFAPEEATEAAAEPSRGRRRRTVT